MITKDSLVHRGAIRTLRIAAVVTFQWNPTHADDIFREHPHRSETTFGYFLDRAKRYLPSKRRDAIAIIEYVSGDTFKETRK